jgi:hypothetical protein
MFGAIASIASKALPFVKTAASVASKALPFISNLLPAAGAVYGARKGADSAEKTTAMNIAHQKEFAKYGIQWRVADAIKAGIHPLAALGANTPAGSPVAVGSSPSEMAGVFSGVGQDISRAIRSTSSKAQRVLSDLNIQSAQLDVQSKHLDNQIKSAQLSKMAQVGPPMPTANNSSFIEGQGDTPLKIDRQAVTSVSRSNPSQFAGGHAGTTFIRTDSGGLVPVMANAQGEQKDDMDIFDFHNMDWFLRNRVLPFRKGIKPPSTKDFPLPKGMRWSWDAWSQQFVPRGHRGSRKIYNSKGGK